MHRVFAFGSNGSGQLGIGHTEDVSEPRECVFVEFDENGNRIPVNMKGKQVQRIACGGNHTIILFEDGSAYASGLNDDARCGVVHHPSLPLTTTSALETTDEEVFPAVVEADGPGTMALNSTTLTRVERIRLRRSRDGMVIDQFRDVCATWSATILVAIITITEAGAEKMEREVVITLGSGDKGELGLGPGRRTTTTTTTAASGSIDRIDIENCIIPNFPPPHTHIKAIHSGMNHTVAILSNGEVYGWGASRKGQLGDDSALIKEKFVWSPVKVELVGMEVDFTALDVGCGREFTFIGGIKKKSRADETEYVYTILGTDDKWDILSSAPSLKTLKTSPLGGRYRVYTSWHGCYLHDILDHSLTAWGRNDRGQLGPSPEQYSSVSQQSIVTWTGVNKFAAGSEHAIALLLDNKTVLACGWGEHGNCGADTDKNGNVKGRVSQIRLPNEVLLDDKSSIVGLGAGCATSWIITSSDS